MLLLINNTFKFDLHLKPLTSKFTATTFSPKTLRKFALINKKGNYGKFPMI